MQGSTTRPGLVPDVAKPPFGECGCKSLRGTKKQSWSVHCLVGAEKISDFGVGHEIWLLRPFNMTRCAAVLVLIARAWAGG